MAPGCPHLPAGSAQGCSLARYLQHLWREKNKGLCHSAFPWKRDTQREAEKRTVAVEKEKKKKTHFQLRGLAFAVIPTSGRAVDTALSLGYTAEIHHAKSHLVP